VLDERRVYSFPARIERNHGALSGDGGLSVIAPLWAARPRGRIAYRFHARDLHLVMGPGTTGPVRFRSPPRRAATWGAEHGVDVDADG